MLEDNPVDLTKSEENIATVVYSVRSILKEPFHIVEFWGFPSIATSSNKELSW